MEARSLAQAHIDECKREREITRRNFEEMERNFNEKHAENKLNREADRERFQFFQNDFQTFQRKLLILAIIVLTALALKGTHLDVLSTFLSTL